MAKLTKDDVLRKAEQLKNWGKWCPDDQLGVLNYVTPEDIVRAAALVRKGKVFRLGLHLDENGPQRGIFGGRWNHLKELAQDCAADGVYEFFFCAPPLVITRGTGSPINPQAIK